jgi:hypothetical protein
MGGEFLNGPRVQTQRTLTAAKLAPVCLAFALSLVGCSQNEAPNAARQSPSVSDNSERAARDGARIEYASALLPPPAGWVPYEFKAGTEKAVLGCAAFSEREWQVASEGDRLKISAYRRGFVEDPLPFDIEPGKAAEGLAGDRHAKRVNDGWLVGFDAGEFGGALWWFSADGGARKRLASENVAALADSPKGVLALVGLAHMGSDRGRVLLVGEGPDGDRPLETIADLGSAPTAFAQESADSLVVVTHKRFLRVKSSGEVEPLLAPEVHFPYANSLALSKSGVIHVGMRHFVLRLSPSNEGYRAEWFVPSDCKTPARAGFFCEGTRMCPP